MTSFTKIIITILAVGIFCEVFFLYYRIRPYYISHEENREACEAQRQKNQELTEMLEEYKTKIERFDSDVDFVVHVARENGYLFPNEVLFKFPSPTE